MTYIRAIREVCRIPMTSNWWLGDVVRSHTSSPLFDRVERLTYIRRARLVSSSMCQGSVLLLVSLVHVLNLVHVCTCKYMYSHAYIHIHAYVHIRHMDLLVPRLGGIIMRGQISAKYRNYATNYASIIHGPKAQLC